MRLCIALLVALILALLAGGAANASELTFTGKTVSPNHTEIFSPHAPAEVVAAYKAAAGAAQSQGQDLGAPGAPFTGKMTVTKLLTGIGQKVDVDQRLLEFTYPPEGLIAERGKLGQPAVTALEAQWEGTRSQANQAAAALDEAKELQERGIASDQAVKDIAQALQVAQLKEQVLADKVRLARDAAEAAVISAQKKFGKNVDKGLLTGRSWIVSPVAGTVLWINPDLTPAMVLDKPTRLFTVGSLDPILVRAWVYESQAVKLRVGDKAQISFESLAGKTFPAAVSRISMTALFLGPDPQLPSLFETDFTVSNPDLLLKEGMRGTIKVQIPDGPR